MDVNGDLASQVTSAMFNDFLSMVRIDGQWMIVNVLAMRLPSPRCSESGWSGAEQASSAQIPRTRRTPL